MREGAEADAALVRDALDDRAAERLPAVLGAIQRSNALAYTRAQALLYSDLALADLALLPASPYREALETLVRFAITRNK